MQLIVNSGYIWINALNIQKNVLPICSYKDLRLFTLIFHFHYLQKWFTGTCNFLFDFGHKNFDICMKECWIELHVPNLFDEYCIYMFVSIYGLWDIVMFMHVWVFCSWIVGHYPRFLILTFFQWIVHYFLCLWVYLIHICVPGICIHSYRVYTCVH